MKRFFSIILAFVIGMTVANAQTVENSELFENISVSVFGGAITTTHPGFGTQPFFWDGFKDVVKGVRPIAGIEFAKYVTPVVGFGLEGIMMFGTTGSNTFVDQSNVVGNLKLNLTNLANGYKGSPKNIELVFVPGLGWGHDYGNVYHDRNYLTYNIGGELNVNLGEKKAWQVNVKPVIMFNNYNNVLRLRKSNMQARIQVGMTYKFGSKQKKSHNFVLCPYSVRIEDYEAALAAIKELEAREPEIKTVIVEKEVVVEKEVIKKVPVTFMSVYFDMGEYAISERELAHIDFYVGNMDKAKSIMITGSADSATGSAERNRFLAEHRALAVKDVLVNTYGFDADKIFIEVVTDIFDEAHKTRVAVVE